MTFNSSGREIHGLTPMPALAYCLGTLRHGTRLDCAGQYLHAAVGRIPVTCEEAAAKSGLFCYVEDASRGFPEEHPMGRTPSAKPSAVKSDRLDLIDRKILSALMRDGRLTNSELAREGWSFAVLLLDGERPTFTRCCWLSARPSSMRTGSCDRSSRGGIFSQQTV